MHIFSIVHLPDGLRDEAFHESLCVGLVALSSSPLQSS